MNEFLLELFGTTNLAKYSAWIILSFIGGLTALLIRNHLTTWKSYSIDYVQILTNLLITFIFIRFGQEVFHVEPAAGSTFLLGLSGNEIALRILRKYLDKKQREEDKLNALAEEQQGPGGSNPPPGKDDK